MAYISLQQSVPSRLRRKSDFSFERTYGATTNFPTELFLDSGLPVPDQNADGNPTACSGYTQGRICSFEDSANYDPLFTYNKTLDMIGKTGQKIGVQITDSMKSTQVYGVKGYSETEQEAFSHKRGAYWDVDKVGDYFDGARSAMTLLSAPLSMGTTWFPEWEPVGNGIYGALKSDGILPMPAAENLTRQNGHNYEVVGWKQINGQPYLILLSWQGANFGDNGKVYMSREVCNAVLDVWGTQLFRFTKATPADVQTIKRSTLEVLLDLYNRLIAFITSSGNSVPVIPSPAVPKPPVVPPKYDWSNPTAARHSVRVLCDEEGLTLEQKNTLCATIACESGFKISTVHPNIANGKIASTDFGIGQWNDFYHGHEITPDEALHNPEKAVRLMIAYWKRGQRGLWVCYSKNLYQKYL